MDRLYYNVLSASSKLIFLQLI